MYRILFVDDEEEIAEIAVEMLSGPDRSVVPFLDPLLALAAFEKDSSAYDVVVTDHNMPDLTGLELVLRVRQIVEYLPAVICTGLPAENEMQEFLGVPHSICLRKPYSFNDLSGRLEELFLSSQRVLELS